MSEHSSTWTQLLAAPRDFLHGFLGGLFGPLLALAGAVGLVYLLTGQLPALKQVTRSDGSRHKAIAPAAMAADTRRSPSLLRWKRGPRGRGTAASYGARCLTSKRARNLDKTRKTHVFPFGRFLHGTKCLLFALFAACALVACTARTEALPPPQNALPAADAVAGWTRTKDSATYDQETLYDFMNGAADLYFTYGFERLAVGNYAHAGGDVLQVEVYRVATDADAYGLFTYNSYGDPLLCTDRRP
jgi:hypothetical protein